MKSDSKMRKASVADLRNKFHQVSAWLANGETVEIFKRRKRFAILMPALQETPTVLPKIDFRAQRQAIWGDRVFSEMEVEAMARAEMEGEEG